MNATMKAPRQLWYSLFSFLSTVIMTLGFTGLDALRYEMVRNHSGLRWYLLESVLMVCLILLTFQRRRWARTAYTVLTSVTVLGMLVLLPMSFCGISVANQAVPHGVRGFISWLLQALLRAVSVYLLYVGQVWRWFAEPRALEHPFSPVTAVSAEGSGSTWLVGSNMHVAPPEPLLASSESKSSALLSSRSKIAKRVGILIGVVIFGVTLVSCALTVLHQRQVRTTDAIRSVLNADTMLAKRVFGSRTMSESDAATLQIYTQGLRKIDMSRCPLDFQMSYLEHIQAWESLMRSRASMDLIGPLFELLVLKQIPQLPDSTDDQPIQNEIARTWDRVERIALIYGVRVPQ